MEYIPSYADSILADIQPSYTDSLTHHGIKGMHWGVRRYQNADGSLTAEGRKRYSSNSEFGKKVAKGVGIAAGVAAAGVGAYAIAKAANPDPFVGKPNYDPETGLTKQIKPDANAKESAMKTNPKAESGDIRYLINCAQCSMAYDLRRRGFDVESARGFFHTQGFIKKAYPNAESHDIPAVSINGVSGSSNRNGGFKNYISNVRLAKAAQEKIETDFSGFRDDQRKMAHSLMDTCSNLGPKARGSICLNLANGMGHCIAFENDENGKTTFIDSQLVGTSYASTMGMGSGRGSASSEYGLWLSSNVSPYMPINVTRYDNTEPNYKYLKKRKVVVPSE